MSDGQSLFGMLDKVMRQVDYHCFAVLSSNRVDPLYKELCLIIAEAFLLKSDSTVNINGSPVQAQLLKEVYNNLNNEHLRLVFDNFNSVAVRVYNKKAYLRTALYNAVFELESTSVNDFRYCAAD
jgi:KaiC/GvpD/RAD55 family RecA-like ATPase